MSGAKLTVGSLAVGVNGNFTFSWLSLFPLPYEAFSGGARKGWASVLITSTVAVSKVDRDNREGGALHWSRLMWFGSSKVSHLSDMISNVQATDRMYSQVLQHLGVPEALRIVNEVVIRLHSVADVPDTPKARRRGQELLEAVERRGCAVEVLRIASQTPRIEVRLEHLGTCVVVLRAGLDEEPVLIEEVEVGLRDGLPGVVTLVGEVCEGFRADARAVW